MLIEQLEHCMENVGNDAEVGVELKARALEALSRCLTATTDLVELARRFFGPMSRSRPFPHFQIMNLGKAISLCRTQRGLTQAELATRAGLSVSYLSLLEQNKRRDPTLSTIQKIAEALRIPSGILFFLAADSTELAGLAPDLTEKLSHAALTLLNDPGPEPTLL